ncbi:MAG: nitroreductase family protein [Muribaculaceae bacterium]|nr:nitroreductase family protein [Muribaculaceae bacterium]
MTTDAIQRLAHRATVRKFTDRKVDDELLNTLLEVAAKAPNTGNMQQYSVIVTRSEEGKQRVAPAHFNQPAATGCDVLLTFCVDFNRFEHWCRVNDARPGYNNLQAFLWGVIDTVIFAQQFNTLAELSGLGCCYLGTTTYNAPAISAALELPDRVVPVVTLAVGYPAEEPTESDRLPIESIVHREKYQPSTDAGIRDTYYEKENLAESRRFVEENNKQTLAQVYTDVRYPRDTNEHFSKVYADFIASKGFC